MLEVAIENSLKKTVKYKMHTGHCSKGMDSKQSKNEFDEEEKHEVYSKQKR